MQITEVIVSAGRTFNHPYENYSNLKPHVSLKATLKEGEDADQAIRDLQAKAEGLVEDHKGIMLKQIAERHEMSVHQAEVARLEAQITHAQERLNDIRQCAAKGLPAPVEEVEAELEETEEHKREPYERRW